MCPDTHPPPTSHRAGHALIKALPPPVVPKAAATGQLVGLDIEVRLPNPRSQATAAPVNTLCIAKLHRRAPGPARVHQSATAPGTGRTGTEKGHGATSPAAGQSKECASPLPLPPAAHRATLGQDRTLSPSPGPLEDCPADGTGSTACRARHSPHRTAFSPPPKRGTTERGCHCGQRRRGGGAGNRLKEGGRGAPPQTLRPWLYPTDITIPQPQPQPHFQPPITAPTAVAPPVTARQSLWNCPVCPPPLQAKP